MIELPIVFQEKIKNILGEEEYQDFLAEFEKGRKYSLRVNTAKISPEEFEQKVPFDLRPIPWVPGGYYYSSKDRPSGHPFYYAGLYYLQEPSAMTPASILPIEKGDCVLDLCAAPGGKATALGAKLEGTGLLVANDISASRARALLKNIEVFGIPNSFITNETPAKLAEYFPSFFDKILVDAPCSGEGMFRKDPEAVKLWTPQRPLECAKLQEEIVDQAIRMLKPGGMMVYSTCTFSPEENEGTIQYILDHWPEMEVLPIPDYEGYGKGIPQLVSGGSQELEHCIRIWPQRMDGEGHFTALLHKKGDLIQNRAPQKKSKKTDPKDREVLEAFMKDVTFEWDYSNIDIRKGQVYLVPALCQIQKGLTFLRNGLYLGEIRKGRFEPSQSLAMALPARGYVSTVDLPDTDVRIDKYLRGETIEVDDISTGKNGWQLVCVDGYPLGWGKLVNGLLKNKYHAGWRKNA